MASAQRDVAGSDPNRRAANILTSVLRKSQVQACCRGSGLPQSLSGQMTGGTSNNATAAWLIAFEMHRSVVAHPHNITVSLLRRCFNEERAAGCIDVMSPSAVAAHTFTQ